MKKIIIIASVCIAAGLSSLNMSGESPKTGNSHNVLVVDTLPAGTIPTRHIGYEFPDDSESEKKPSFPGGEEALFRWLSRNIIYPAAASEEKIEGKVVIAFVIEKDGSVSNVNAELKAHPALDAEAIRVVQSMPKWEPGTVDGEPVRVLYHLPISFKLPEEAPLDNKSSDEESDEKTAIEDDTSVPSLFAVNGDSSVLMAVIPDENPVPRVVLKQTNSTDPIVAPEYLDQQPSFPGGQEELIKFLQDNIKYPEGAKEISAEGTVTIVFELEKDGAVSNIKVIRSSNFTALDEEALYAVSRMPNWSPGMLHGQPVRTRFIFPVTFHKPEEEQAAE